MQPDSARLSDARAWLVKARTDLAAGEHALTADAPFVEDAAFHAQQSAEKSMKGFLAWHDEPFRKTHNLTELGHLCSELAPPLAPTLEASSYLTEYAWRFRYPGDHGELTVEQAREALAVAGRLLSAIVARIPEVAGP